VPKKMELIENPARGIDLLVERDAGNLVRILTGKPKYSRQFWSAMSRNAKIALEQLKGRQEVAMPKWVIRLDLEVEAENEEAVGAMVNDMIGFAADAVEPEHYRWAIAQADEGLDDPNVEKDLQRALAEEYQGVQLPEKPCQDGSIAVEK
jgi:hypothetical protein